MAHHTQQTQKLAESWLKTLKALSATSAMAIYGPDMAPRSVNHELQVLDVHVARNAQRRLAENARAARDENATVLELEEHCLEEPPVADVTGRAKERL